MDALNMQVDSKKISPKILHSVLMLRPSVGIINQMNWEAAAAKQEFLNWDARIFSPYRGESDELFVTCELPENIESKSIWKKINTWISFRRKYYSWLMHQSCSYDALILRHSVADPFQYFFIRGLKKPIFLVHHTLELPELSLEKGFLARSKILAEQILGALSIRAAIGVIGVTKEISVYEINRAKTPKKSSYVYPNGITYSHSPIMDSDISGERIPNIIFVASYFFPWHGLDLLLENIAASDSKFKLHLVGTLSDEDQKKAQCDNRVLVHGQLTTQAISEISKKCRLGLSSFALHRNSMNEACTLKTREYLMSGLAVYSGHKDVFPDDFSYYRFGLPNIDSILQFYKEISSVSMMSISKESEKYISKRVVLADLNRWICDQIESK